MRRIAVAGLVLGLTAAGATACSSSGSSSASSGTSSSSSLCDSVAALKLSAAKLTDMQVSQNGVSGMRDQLKVVGTDLSRVVDLAKNKYSDVAAVVQKDVDALKSAASGVKDNPSRESLDAVRAPLNALVDDVKALNARVSSGCS